jgi:YYY domain-containing protein
MRMLARPIALLVLGGLLVGTLRATNTWELPTYLALAGLITVIATRPGRWVGWPTALMCGAVVLGLVYAVSSATFAPFLARYELFYSGVVPVRTPTAPHQFLLINGVLLFVVVAYLAHVLARSVGVAAAVTRGACAPAPTPAASYLSLFAPTLTLAGDGRISMLAMTVLGPGAILWAGGYGTLGMIFVVGSIIAGVAAYRRASRELLFVAGLAAAALGSLALPEVVAVKGDVGRMNTVFKFYLQAWILLALLAGPATVLLWGAFFPGRPQTGAPAGGTAAVAVLTPSLAHGGGDEHAFASHRAAPEQFGNVWHYAWASALVLLIAACAVYPILATRTKVGLRFESLPPTLDGMAYMEEAHYRDRQQDLELPDDFHAIRWMMENVNGTPVILEGSAPLYHWGSRFSIYTGLPTVIGWDWHQKQQRSGYSERVDQRVRDVNRFYETPDADAAWATIRKYGVRLIVVGGLERAYYPAAGLAKFDRMVGDGLEVAYRAGSITVFQVTAP